MRCVPDRRCALAPTDPGGRRHRSAGEGPRPDHHAGRVSGSPRHTAVDHPPPVPTDRAHPTPPVTSVAGHADRVTQAEPDNVPSGPTLADSPLLAAWVAARDR